MLRQVVVVRGVRAVRVARRRAVARAQVRRRAVVLRVVQRQRGARRPPVAALFHLTAGTGGQGRGQGRGQWGASCRAAARAAPRARQRVRVRMRRRVPAPRLALAPRHFETRGALAAPALTHPCIRSQLKPSLHPWTLHARDQSVGFFSKVLSRSLLYPHA